MTARDVLDGRRQWACEAADAVAFLAALPDGCVDLVLFSPPYEAARLYGVGFKLRGQAWVDWLRPIVRDACRVSAGLVVVNASGQVRGASYSPVMEYLTADLCRLDGLAVGPQPYAWVRNGIPGSGHKTYHRRDWEPVYCYARPANLPPRWADNRAFGHPPKYGPGGAMSNRTPSGKRVSKWGGSPTSLGRTLDGRKMAPRPGQFDHSTPAIANPGNVLRTRGGGGHLGHELAHENEAPMAMAVAERFVCWYCPPGGVVCDPFSGSGTTCHAAIEHGRRFVGCDLRQSQVELCSRRMATVTPPLFADAPADPPAPAPAWVQPGLFAG